MESAVNQRGKHLEKKSGRLVAKPAARLKFVAESKPFTLPD
jgi:hypothetical protein